MNHDKKRVVAWAIIAALALLVVAGVATAVGAQTSANYDLTWHVAASGGSDMASARYMARTTLGQFAIGPAGSPDYAVDSGYWHGIRLSIRFYLPLVLRSCSP